MSRRSSTVDDVAEGFADLVVPIGSQRSDAIGERRLRQGLDVVEGSHALDLEPFVGAERHLGRDASPPPCHWCHHDPAEHGDRLGPRQDEVGAWGAVGELAPPDLVAAKWARFVIMIANPARICNPACMFDRPTWRNRIEEAWTRRSLVWLVGVRRVGKTVLCRSLKDVEYLDCELPSVRRALEDPESFLRSVGGKRVVLDEIHRLPDPSELLKIAADHFPDVRVLATGSSTLQATAKFRDSLAGRKEEVWLTPMIEADRASAGGTLADRLGLGGLPPFFLGDATEREAQEWLDAYWAKDVQELFRLERRASFVRFVELVLARSGGIFEATAFAGPAEASRTTIGNYLSALEITKVAHVIRPFSTRRSTEIVHAPKVFGFDTGFVKMFRGWGELRTEDLGLLWEHYVLNELQARALPGEIRHWRSTKHQEVDFVFVRRGRPPTAIECKWRADGREDLSGLKAFRRAYPKGPSFVVAAGVERGFERELLPDVPVRYLALEELVRSLT